METNLTALQANQLANDFLETAIAIREYIEKNEHNMSIEEYKLLNTERKNILSNGKKMILTAVELTMNEADESLEKINNITKQIKKDIHKIENVQKVVDIVTSLSSLVLAIICKNVNSISNSLDRCFELWNSLSENNNELLN